MKLLFITVIFLHLFNLNIAEFETTSQYYTSSVNQECVMSSPKYTPSYSVHEQYVANSDDCLPGRISEECKVWKMTNAIILKTDVDSVENRNTIQQYIDATSANCTSSSQVQFILPRRQVDNECSYIYSFKSAALMRALKNFNYSNAVAPVDKYGPGNSMFNLLESVVHCMRSKLPNTFDGAVLNVFTDMTYIDLCGSDNFVKLFPDIISQLKEGGYTTKFIFLNQSLAGNQRNVEAVLRGCKYNDDEYFCEIIDSSRLSEGDVSHYKICLGNTTNNDNVKNLNLELLLIIGIPCVSLTICCVTMIICCLKCAKFKMQMIRWKIFGEKENENEDCGERGWFRGNRFKRNNSGRKNKDVWPHFASANTYMDIHSLSNANKKDIWEIDSKNLLIQEDHLLGNGAFANVYKGIVKGKIPLLVVNNSLNLVVESENNGHFDAAVKKLPAHADEQNHLDFFHEIEFMKRLGHHPHIVSMLGCVSNPYQPLIVVEYCARGDLLKFLRRHKEYVLMNKTDECPIGADICVRIKDLVSIAWQVADGMTYLKSKNFIHRDLAARNILLTKNMTAKISDFGLCRYMDSALYTAKGGRLPIKWMSIEALRLYEFSSKSDVWSYGVLLFEIFSLGDVPYPTIQQMDMLEHLQSGNRLPQPLKCPNEIYSLMKRCWLENPEDRPEFNEMRGEITLMLNLDDESYGYLNLESDEGYPKYKSLTMQELNESTDEGSSSSKAVSYDCPNDLNDEDVEKSEEDNCEKLSRIMCEKFGPEQADEIKLIICDIFPKQNSVKKFTNNEGKID